MPTREISVHPCFRIAEVEQVRAAGDGSQDLVMDLAFSSEYPVERMDWYEGPYLEILDHDSRSIDLDRLNDGAPFLMDHDPRHMAGVVDSARIEDRRGRATIRLSENARNLPGYGDVVSDFQRGIRRKVSVGYRILEAVLEKEVRDGPDEIRITRWMPFEVSSVSIPADPSVGVDRAADEMRRSYKPNQLKLSTREDHPMPDDKKRQDNTPENTASKIESGIADALTSLDNNITGMRTDFSASLASLNGKRDDNDAPANGGAARTRSNDERSQTLEQNETARKRELARINRIDEIETHIRKIGADEDKLAELKRTAREDGRSADQFFTDAMELAGKGQGQERVLNQDSSNPIGMEAGDLRNYSVMRACHLMDKIAQGSVTQRDYKDAGLELEVHRAAMENWDRKREVRGVLIPDDVLTARIYPIEATGLRNHRAAVAAGRWMQRDLTVGAGSVSNMVETTVDMVSFIDLLYARLVIMGLGARTISGLVGDLAIPRMTTGSTVTYVGEATAGSESTPVFDQVTLTPKTATTFVDISRKSMLQTNAAVEAIVMDDLARQFALKMDASAINGNPDASATPSDPRGILYTTGTGSSTGDGTGYTMVTELEAEVAIDDADVGALGFLTNPQVRKVLRRAKIDTGSGELVWPAQAGTLLGYNAAVSTQVPSDLQSAGDKSAMIFGNWNDLLIGIWSGLDIIRDPYSASTKGDLRIVAFHDHDIAVRHAESFATAEDLAT